MRAGLKFIVIAVLIALLAVLNLTPAPALGASTGTTAGECCPGKHCPERDPMPDSCSTADCPLFVCVSVNTTPSPNVPTPFQGADIPQVFEVLPQPSVNSINKLLHDEVQVFRAPPEPRPRCRNSLEPEKPLPF